MKKSIKGIFTIIAAAVAISGVTLMFAMPDETNSVHIDASEIEDSTLIIGSHLIYLESMNDQIYQIAKESAEDFNQHNTYYKSEVAGGTWYEISEAGALADITTEGVVVDEKEIEELWMTHHTKSDGITYDLLTGASVSVFDIQNPYNLEEMEELEPIKIQYDLLQQLEDKSDTNERDILYIEEVYNKNRETEATKQLDQQMDALQAYYEILIRDDAESAMSDMVSSVIEKIDAARRVEVLTTLNDSELQKMNNVIGREFIYIPGEITGDFEMSEDRKKRAEEAVAAVRGQVEAEIAQEKEALETFRTYIETKVSEAGPEEAQAIRDSYAEELRAKEEAVRNLEENKEVRIEEAEQAAMEAVMNEEREKVEDFVLNIDLVNAIGEAMSNVQESYISYSAKMLEEGTTILSKTEYRLIQDLINYAKVQDYSSCDEVVKKLIYLDRVNNSVILEEIAEREFIAAELIGAAEEAYKASLGEGEGEAYKMLSSMASAATKASVLKKQLNETDVIRNELQFILQAYTDRMPMEDAVAYITERIDQMDAYREIIKEDAYAEYANSSLDAHLDWANSMLSNIQNLAGNGQMDYLLSQKEELQTELMTALDKNQLDKVKKLEAEIAAIDKETEELEKELNQILNANTSSESEKALAAAQLGAKSASKTLQNMKENALEEIREGNLDGIENIIDGIGSLAATQPEGALGVLQDIYQELVNQDLMSGGSAALDDLMGKVEDVTTEQMDNFLGNLAENDFANLIQGFLEENMTDAEAQDEVETLDDVMDALSDEDMAMALAGISMYADQTGSENANDILQTYANVAINDGNPYVFKTYSGDVLYEYIPTDKLARITGFRYIFNDSQKSVTLQKNSQYYKFSAFSNLMQKEQTEIEMTRAAGFEGVIYIPRDAAEVHFSLTAKNLSGTSNGLILTEDMQEQANIFLDYLLEAGGSF